MRILLAIVIWLFLSTIANADPVPFGVPGVNTPFTGCVEGRALRIVGGQPSCASTVPPSLTSCGAGSVDATATDFIGQVSVPAGLKSCTIVMTKLYAANFICIVQAQSGTSLSLGAATVGNNGTLSTLTVPFGANIAATKFGYICGPG